MYHKGFSVTGTKETPESFSYGAGMAILKAERKPKTLTELPASDRQKTAPK